jgi:hypothetical protein
MRGRRAATEEVGPGSNPHPRRWDIKASQLPEMDWSDGSRAIEILYHRAEDFALDTIAWYLSEKQRCARWSRSLRAISILFAIAGGLVPLVHAANPAIINAEWGYVFLGIAGGLLALDRLFGFSNSYMRYMATALTLEAELIGFQMEWAASRIRLADGDASAADSLIADLREFMNRVLNLVQSETSSWSHDLIDQLNELSRASKPSHAAREGS